MTAYTIKVRESDLQTYTISLKTCDGSLDSVVTTRICSIPIETLRTSPFNLMWGMSVYAIVSATNVYGTSIDSSPGNGAIILTVPSPPISLSNVPVLTNGVQIGITWTEGEMNGGAPV